MQRLLFAVFATLALSSFSAALPGEKNRQSIQWVDCASNVPSSLQGSQLPAKLPSTLHCGRLNVPMDYEQPISENNKITLGFSMYRPKHPRGLINFNPGGPNGEVSPFAWEIALNSSLFNGLEDFDFLAMDVRGTFSSNPLNCSLSNFTVPSSFPTNQADLAAYQAAASSYAQSCIDLSTPKGIVEHVGTSETVQDWNSLRKALGYETMHFLSVSYGTFGAAVYAKQFPQHVGRFVLDGVLPHGISNLDLVTFQVRAVNRLLLRADAFCINDTACPFHSQGKGSVINAFRNVLDLAQSGAGVNTTADDVRAMVTLAYLSLNPDFPALNLALHGALNGNWSGLSYASFAPTYTAELFLVLPTLCLDQHVENNTLAGFDSIRQSVTKDDPAQIEYSQDMTLIAFCGGWPFQGKSNEPLPLNTSLLLVTSDFDLNTPTESSTLMWGQAPNSALVVRHGDDHGTFFVQGPARLAEMDFLATGNLPKPTNETFVTIYAPGGTRDAIGDPYTVPVGPLAGDMSSIQ